MDLRHLRYFVAVAESEQVSKAAKALNLSQSPLSRQIAQLERELGVGLFEHARKRLRLTGPGRQVLADAKLLLAHADRLKADARRLGQGMAGNVDIGYVPTAVHNGMLAGLLLRLRDEYPDIRLRLYPLLSHPQLSRLADGGLDIGLLYSPAHAAGVQSRHLLYDPIVMLLPEGHPLATAARITVALLRKQSWIVAPAWSEWEDAEAFHESDVRLALRKACNEAGFEPFIAFETLDVDSSLSAVKAGLGITLGQASLANAAKGIVARKMPIVDLRLDLVAAWRPSALSAAASIVLELLCAKETTQ